MEIKEFRSRKNNICLIDHRLCPLLWISFGTHQIICIPKSWTALITIFDDGGPLLHVCFLSTPPPHAWIPKLPSVVWLCCVLERQVHYRLHCLRWAFDDRMTRKFCLVRSQLRDCPKLCVDFVLVSYCVNSTKVFNT